MPDKVVPSPFTPNLKCYKITDSNEYTTDQTSYVSLKTYSFTPEKPIRIVAVIFKRDTCRENYASGSGHLSYSKLVIGDTSVCEYGTDQYCTDGYETKEQRENPTPIIFKDNETVTIDLQGKAEDSLAVLHVKNIVIYVYYEEYELV